MSTATKNACSFIVRFVRRFPTIIIVTFPDNYLIGGEDRCGDAVTWCRETFGEYAGWDYTRIFNNEIVGAPDGSFMFGFDKAVPVNRIFEFKLRFG